MSTVPRHAPISLFYRRAKDRLSGGFFGLLKTCELDTDAAIPSETFSGVTPEELELMVKTSGLQGGGAFFSESSRELYRYNITIADGDSEVSVAYDDVTLPASAHVLVDYLRQHARPKALVGE